MRRSRAQDRVNQGRTGIARYVEDLDELKGIVALLQSQGKVVVYAAGSFDLLHVGHVRCLKDAKSRGDFLIIGIRSNEAVRKAEGPGFPLHQLEERVELLSAFGFVDYITRVDVDNDLTVVETLNPSVLAVSDAEKRRALIDEAAVKKIGCSFIVVGGPALRTTQDTLSRIWALNTPSASEDLALKEVAGTGRQKSRKKKQAAKKTVKKFKAKTTKKSTSTSAKTKKAKTTGAATSKETAAAVRGRGTGAKPKASALKKDTAISKRGRKPATRAR